MKLKTFSAFALSIFLSGLGANNASANHGLKLGPANYGGSGCPQGSAEIVLSPDQQSLSLLFDSYFVEAGQNLGKRLDRKNCALAIPLEIPNGISVSILKVDYRGYAFVPRGARVRFKTESFMAGDRGPTLVKNFKQGFDDNFFISKGVVVGGTAWSECGKDAILRVNTSLLARASRNSSEVFASVDTTDMESGMIYHLDFKNCEE